eukprot:123140-Rhodomonas_salina.2
MTYEEALIAPLSLLCYACPMRCPVLVLPIVRGIPYAKSGTGWPVYRVVVAPLYLAVRALCDVCYPHISARVPAPIVLCRSYS